MRMLSAPPLRPVTAPVLCPLEPVALIVVSEFIQTFCNTGQFTTSRVILGAVKLDQYGFHVRTLVCQWSLNLSVIRTHYFDVFETSVCPRGLPVCLPVITTLTRGLFVLSCSSAHSVQFEPIECEQYWVQ